MIYNGDIGHKNYYKEKRGGDMARPKDPNVRVKHPQEINPSNIEKVLSEYLEVLNEFNTIYKEWGENQKYEKEYKGLSREDKLDKSRAQYVDKLREQSKENEERERQLCLLGARLKIQENILESYVDALFKELDRGSFKDEARAKELLLLLNKVGKALNDSIPLVFQLGTPLQMGRLPHHPEAHKKIRTIIDSVSGTEQQREWKKHLKSSGWEQFLKDVNRGLLIDGVSYSGKLFNIPKEKQEEADAIKKMLQEKFTSSVYEQINTFYCQDAVGPLSQKITTDATSPYQRGDILHLPFSYQRIANVFVGKDGRVYVDSIAYGLYFESTSGVKLFLPGSIATRLVFTDAGLQYVSYEASNSLLDDLCVKGVREVISKELYEKEGRLELKNPERLSKAWEEEERYVRNVIGHAKGDFYTFFDPTTTTPPGAAIIKKMAAYCERQEQEVAAWKKASGSKEKVLDKKEVSEDKVFAERFANLRKEIEIRLVLLRENNKIRGVEEGIARLGRMAAALSHLESDFQDPKRIGKLTEINSKLKIIDTNLMRIKISITEKNINAFLVKIKQYEISHPDKNKEKIEDIRKDLDRYVASKIQGKDIFLAIYRKFYELEGRDLLLGKVKEPSKSAKTDQQGEFEGLGDILNGKILESPEERKAKELDKMLSEMSATVLVDIPRVIKKLEGIESDSLEERNVAKQTFSQFLDKSSMQVDRKKVAIFRPDHERVAELEDLRKQKKITKEQEAELRLEKKKDVEFNIFMEKMGEVAREISIEAREKLSKTESEKVDFYQSEEAYVSLKQQVALISQSIARELSKGDDKNIFELDKLYQKLGKDISDLMISYEFGDEEFKKKEVDYVSSLQEAQADLFKKKKELAAERMSALDKEPLVAKPTLQQPLLAGSIPGRSSVTLFTEEPVEAKGDCGFIAIGASREEVVKVLMTLKGNEGDRESLVEEIRAAFMVGDLVATAEWTRLDKARIEQQENFDVLFRSIRDSLPDDDIGKSFELDNLITWLEAQGNADAAKLAGQQSAVSQAEKALEDYCKSEQTYELYVKALGGRLWLGYKSALLYAREKDISLYIWRKDKTGNLSLIDCHEAVKPGGQVIHMLHTSGFTHFNRLVEAPQQTLAEQLGPEVAPSLQSKSAVAEELQEELVPVPLAEEVQKELTPVPREFMAKVERFYGILKLHEGDEDFYKKNAGKIYAVRQKFDQRSGDFLFGTKETEINFYEAMIYSAKKLYDLGFNRDQLAEMAEGVTPASHTEPREPGERLKNIRMAQLQRFYGILKLHEGDEDFYKKGNLLINKIKNKLDEDFIKLAIFLTIENMQHIEKVGSYVSHLAIPPVEAVDPLSTPSSLGMGVVKEIPLKKRFVSEVANKIKARRVALDNLEENKDKEKKKPHEEKAVSSPIDKIFERKREIREIMKNIEPILTYLLININNSGSKIDKKEKEIFLNDVEEIGKRLLNLKSDIEDSKNKPEGDARIYEEIVQIRKAVEDMQERFDEYNKAPLSEKKSRATADDLLARVEKLEKESGTQSTEEGPEKLEVKKELMGFRVAGFLERNSEIREKIHNIVVKQKENLSEKEEKLLALLGKLKKTSVDLLKLKEGIDAIQENEYDDVSRKLNSLGKIIDEVEKEFASLKLLVEKQPGKKTSSQKLFDPSEPLKEGSLEEPEKSRVENDNLKKKSPHPPHPGIEED